MADTLIDAIAKAEAAQKALLELNTKPLVVPVPPETVKEIEKALSTDTSFSDENEYSIEELYWFAHLLIIRGNKVEASFYLDKYIAALSEYSPGADVLKHPNVVTLKLRLESQ